MTIIMHKSHAAEPAVRSSMPGWGITADLTPPELRTQRSLIVVRRALVGALVLVVLLCAAGYWFSRQANDSAQSRLDATTTQSAGIQAMIDKHSDATRVKAATAAINAQLATLFASDVDVPKIVARLSAAASSGLKVTGISVSVSPSSVTTDLETGTSSIGTVTLTGTSHQLVDVASYVNALQRITGVTDVIPSTNIAGGSWAITLQLTTALQTHRYASTTTSSTGTPTSTTSTATGGN